MKYTQEQIDNRSSDYVCFDCGIKFLTEKQKESSGSGTTFHQNTCCLCGEDTAVTHIRQYNRLNLANGENL